MLQAKVEAQTGVLPAVQVLTLGSESGVLDGTTPLTGATATLASLGVLSGGNVDVSLLNNEVAAPPPFALKVEMPASLRALYGETITIPTSASETVANVKAKVEAITGMSPSEQVKHPARHHDEPREVFV
jgi:hypothetical protein